MGFEFYLELAAISIIALLIADLIHSQKFSRSAVLLRACYLVTLFTAIINVLAIVFYLPQYNINVVVMYVITDLIYLLNAIIVYLLLLYIGQIANAYKAYKKYVYLLFGLPFIAYACVLFANHFAPIFYSISPDGVLINGKYFNYVYESYLTATVLMGSGILIVKRKNLVRKQYGTIIMFSAFLIISILVVLESKGIPYMSFPLALLYMYLYFKIQKGVQIEEVVNKSEEKHRNELSRYLNYDDVTELYNRKAFLCYVKETLDISNDIKYQIIAFKIHNYKRFKNSHLESETDGLLREVAAELNQCADGQCLISRFERDEFLIFCPDDASYTARFTKKMRVLLDLRYPSQKFSPYFGIYEITDKALPVEEMCNNAIHTLTITKSERKYTVNYYSGEIVKKYEREQTLLNGVAKAIEEKQFLVYVQP